jgi:RimJ/RimL family protein N-acetyltransferase
MTGNLVLRPVAAGDLSIFFEQQLDEEANRMAAFTAKDPTNKEAFKTHWDKLLSDESVHIKTIVFDQSIVGYVLSYYEAGKLEVSYWIGKTYWGKGITTQALTLFLQYENKTRPIHARVAKDNQRSLRVLEKCGFTIIGEDKGFANAREDEVEEYILELNKTSDEHHSCPPLR